MSFAIRKNNDITYISNNSATGDSGSGGDVSGTNYWSLSGSNLYNNTGSRVGINTTSPTYVLDVSTSDISSMKVGNCYFDSLNNRLSIDKSVSFTSGTVSPQNYGIRIVKESPVGAAAALQIYRNDSGSSQSKIELFKSRGTFVAPSSTTTGDTLSTITTYGYNTLRPIPNYFSSSSIIVTQVSPVAADISGGYCRTIFRTFGLQGGNVDSIRIDASKNVLGNSTIIQESNADISPNSRSILELNSTTKGFLPPRMTGNEALNINPTASEAGLMVYATDTSGAITAAGWWGWNGSSWRRLDNP
jgi:hypothetical protein